MNTWECGFQKAPNFFHKKVEVIPFNHLLN